MFVFFSLFYYTDNGSLLSVLLYLQLNLLEASLLVTFPVGFISLLFRQTNIIWLLYSTAISILYRDDELGEFIRSVDKQLVLLSDNFRPFSRYFWDNIASILVYLIFGLPSRMSSIIKATSSFLINLGLFVTFIYFNNGNIVLGDVSAHQPTLHLLQIGYFGLFNLIFAWPRLLNFEFIKYLFDNKRNLVILSLAFLYLTANHFIVHPYLLADNRHYIFYIFKIISKMRWLFCPIYSVGLLSIFFQMPKSILIHLAFMCCTVVTLVPQKLFEFRYFMVPYMILQIFDPRQKDESRSKILFQIFYNIMITTATLFIFKTKG